MVLLTHFVILQVPLGSVLDRGYFGRDDKYFMERSFSVSIFLCFDLLNFLMTSLSYAMQSR
jgi:hypothetical protein